MAGSSAAAGPGAPSGGDLRADVDGRSADVPAAADPIEHASRSDAIARRHPLTLIALAVLFWSGGPVIVASTSASGLTFAFWRLWFGVVLLGLVTLVYSRFTTWRPSRATFRYVLWVGLAFAAHQIFFVTAIKSSSVVDVTVIGTLQPILVGVAAVPLFGERPTWRFRAWSLVAILGAAWVVVAGSTGVDGNPVGMVLSVANVVAFSAFFLTMKIARPHVPVVPLLFGVMIVASVCVTAFDLAVGADLTAVTGSDLLGALAVAVVPGLLGHAFMSWPLPWVPANLPPIVKLAIPLVSGFLAWAILGQSITWLHVAGGLVTVAGVAGALLTYGAAARGAALPPPAHSANHTRESRLSPAPSEH